MTDLSALRVLVEKARCAVTGNPVGTDTMAEGYGCTCAQCFAWRTIGFLPTTALDLIARIERLESEVAAEKAVATAAVESLCKWRAAFQECTPGGSEFMTPESTREYMLNLKRETVEARLSAVRERRRAEAAEATAAKMREELEDCRRIIGKLNSEKHSDWQATIAEAVETERERCAQIAYRSSPFAAAAIRAARASAAPPAGGKE